MIPASFDLCHSLKLKKGSSVELFKLPPPLIPGPVNFLNGVDSIAADFRIQHFDFRYFHPNSHFKTKRFTCPSKSDMALNFHGVKSSTMMEKVITVYRLLLRRLGGPL